MTLREDWERRAQARGRERNDQSLARPSAGYGLTSGGIVNPLTGAGTGADHSTASIFQPTRIYYQTPLEVLLVESWTARHAVSMPVDDQFITWREFVSEQDATNEAMAEAEDRHRVTTQLAKVMRAARQFGTGVLVMMTKETGGDLTQPLIPERIRPGDLTALRVFNRFEVTCRDRSWDLMDPNYGRPEFYDLFPRRGGRIMGGTAAVHHSRVLRFDGLTANTDSGYSAYDWDWGMPSLVPIMTALLQDQVFVSAIAHLGQEASIPILKIAGLGESRAGLASAADPDAPDVEQIGAQLNRIKSVFRLLMMDKDNEDFERVAVAFSGIANVMDKFVGRVAAAAQIPETRMMGRSPAGLNATGESDMENYVAMIESERERLLTPQLAPLDMVLARDCGLAEPPEFEWGTLMERTPADEAETAKLKAEAVKIATDTGNIDPDEGREALSGDPVFGALPGPAPEPPEPELVPGMPGMNGDGPSGNGAGAMPPNMSDEQRAEVVASIIRRNDAEALRHLVEGGFVDEDEARERAAEHWGAFSRWDDV